MNDHEKLIAPLVPELEQGDSQQRTARQIQASLKLFSRTFNDLMLIAFVRMREIAKQEWNLLADRCYSLKPPGIITNETQTQGIVMLDQVSYSFAEHARIDLSRNGN